MKSLGIYIHIPFCKRKCRYCDFVSYPDMQNSFDKYIDAVISEVNLYADYLKEYAVDTVFIGGGTPSLLSAKQIQRLLGGIKEICNFKAKEITMEANPESLNREKMQGYAQCGINRLSIGLQTHDNDILKRIGRWHTYDMFLEAVSEAKNYFSNISADIIFALPGQSQNNFKTTVQRLIDLSLPHISAYALKLEPGTKLESEWSGADEQDDRSMYHSAADMLEKAGYDHYETSNFAKKGFECLHNLKYWTGKEYLGFGAAAHSYMTEADKIRFSNTKDLNEYFDSVSDGKKPVDIKTSLSNADEKTEYIMLRLRLKRGIDFKEYNERFDSDFENIFSEPIEYSKKAGLITADSNGIYPTIKGFDLQNTLITEFMKKL